MEEINTFENLIRQDKYQVFLLACPAYFPFYFFRHPWFVLNKKGVISRWEIRHYSNSERKDFLFINEQPSFQGTQITFGLKKFWPAKLVGFIEGDENSVAKKAIEFIENSERNYPYCKRYSFCGPNSNTYAQNVLSNFPEFNIKLNWRFIGRNYKLKNKMIKAIVFDYGGVIEITDRGLMQNIADFLQISFEDWIKEYSSLNYLCNTGKNSYEEVYAMVARKFGASDAQVFHIHNMMKENMETRKINWDLIETIKKLKNNNYKIGLLSNNYIKLRQQMTDEGTIEYFDPLIVSSEVGCQKPQPEIFEILIDKLGIKMEELVFIDDSKSSLAGADKIGYTPILYIDNEQLKNELQNLGIKL